VPAIGKFRSKAADILLWNATGICVASAAANDAQRWSRQDMR